MKKIILICFVLITSTFYVKAQQDAQYSQYMFNSLVINPGYAGYKQSLNASGLYRLQWVGVDGAPTTQSLVLDGSFFDDKIGIGLTTVKDRIGLQELTSTYLNAAYKLTVSNGAILSFGIGAGLNQFNFNTGNALTNDPNDPTYALGEGVFSAPDIRSGIHYSTYNFYAGFSATNMLSSFMDYGSTARNSVIKQGRHYFLTAGYLLEINDFLKFKPSFLIKEDTKGPTNLDINNFFLLSEKVWLGASYRTSVNWIKRRGVNGDVRAPDAIVGLVEVFATEGVRIGYAYDHAMNSIKGNDFGSHEISVSVTFGPKRKVPILSPRYF